MAKRWKDVVERFIQALRPKVKEHPELQPLFTSLVNFNKKYCQAAAPDADNLKDNTSSVKLSSILAFLDEAGLVVIEKESYEKLMRTIEQQADEIEALDNRIKRLLEH